MATTRLFRPALVTDLAGGWLAVDEQQPVAVAVGPAGEVGDVVSWSELPAPRRFDWPRREVVADGTSVWVHDRPDGPTVRIARTGAGGLSVTAEPRPERSPGQRRAYSRFSLSGEPGTADGHPWRFSSDLADYRWSARVRRGDQVWLLGDGSISSFAAAGGAAAVCIRRAPKRPWAFRPDHQLFLLGAGAEPTAVLPGGLDVTELGWPGPDLTWVSQALVDYLPFTIAECQHAVEAGAVDVRFEVDGLRDGLPTIATSFDWGTEGTRYVRVDEPLDEVGRAVGFRALGIILDEDLRGSDLYGPAAPG